MDAVPMRFYKLNMYFFILVGQWPYKCPEIIKFLLRVGVVLTFTLIILFQIAYFVESKFELEKLLDVVPVFVFMIVLLSWAFIFAFIKVDEFEDLWNIMLEDWASERIEEETKIKETYAATGFLITKILAVILTMGEAIFIIGTLSLAKVLDIIHPLNESHPLSLPLPMIELAHRDDLILFFLLCEEGSVMVSIAFGLANISMMCVHLQHIYGMFAVIGYRLQNALPDDMSQLKDTCNKVNDTYYESISLCIKRHQLAIQFAALLESYYGLSFVFCLVGSILILTPTLVLIQDLDILNFKTVPQILLVVGLVFIYNAFGQKLTDSSLKIAEKAYNSPWYRCSPGLQKLVILIIRRCDIPCRITALNLYTASLSCFRMIMQTGVSYCMIIRQFQ